MVETRIKLIQSAPCTNQPQSLYGKTEDIFYRKKKINTDDKNARKYKIKLNMKSERKLIGNFEKE